MTSTMQLLKLIIYVLDKSKTSNMSFPAHYTILLTPNYFIWGALFIMELTSLQLFLG